MMSSFHSGLFTGSLCRSLLYLKKKKNLINTSQYKRRTLQILCFSIRKYHGHIPTHEYSVIYKENSILLPCCFLYLLPPTLFMLSAILKNSSRRAVLARPTATRVRYLATVNPFFPDEPSKPNMVTSVPGPKSKQIMSQLNQYQDTRSIFFVAGNVYCQQNSYRLMFFFFFFL